jgi:23S rRNA (adenine2503-C2)-methyltransferase
MKEALFGKTLDELIPVVKEAGLPAFTAHQIADWLYKKEVKSIDDMTNLSKKAREFLDIKYEVGLTPHKSVQSSVDGTKKYLFPSGDKKFIEAAYIPEHNRSTLCLSSQVGCKMGCLFCMTGKQGFQGQLSVTEILNQVVSLPERESLTNIVYMGMGEPFDNLENVLKSVEILTAEWGFAMSPRRITVSSIGLLPAVQRFLHESEAHLAISLHTPFVEERKSLMPIESVSPIEDVLKIIKDFDWGRQRRVSFEYIMFKGVNDSQAHSRALVKLLDGLRCRVNLIRFHPIPGTPLKSSDNETIVQFRDRLNDAGLVATIRASRGEDIFAACGLLSTKELSKEEGEKDY